MRRRQFLWKNAPVSPVLHLVLLSCLTAQGVSVEEVVAENEAVVLVIRGVRSSENSAVQSSGVIVDRRGIVLTTAHQVNGVEGLEGELSRGAPFSLTVLEMDVDQDLALLRADREFPGQARLGNAERLRPGAALITIAAPAGLDFSVGTGILSSANRTYRGYPILQAELVAAPGSSGGPVFNAAGEVVGIIVGVLPDQPWATMIVPVNSAYDMLARNAVIGFVTSDNDREQELIPVEGISDIEMRALAAYNLGTRTKALGEKMEYYALAVKLLPKFYEAWFNLAVAALGAENIELARDAYLNAQALRPDQVETRRNLGRLYLRTGEMERAVGVFEEAVKLAPNMPQSYNDVGEAYRKAGRYAQAMDSFAKALELDPRYANAHYNLGVVLMQAEQWEQAKAAFEQYLRIVPDTPDRSRVETWMRAMASRTD